MNSEHHFLMVYKSHLHPKHTHFILIPYSLLLFHNHTQNVFLPNDENRDKSAIMIDFASAGIGYGMSDVAMHIVHAILPADLDNNGGEEQLVEGYLVALEHAMNRKVQHATKEQWTYPREAAMRHYQLACIDYLRFIMGRFWRSATPESFEKKKSSKNTTLINRNLDSALRFIDKVDVFLKVFEAEKRERAEDKLSGCNL